MTEREIIRIEDLSKSFYGKQGEVVALEKIDLSIRKGEIFGVIGLSGAGKSTLVRCINFLERPTQGRVIFDGKDLSQLNEAELRLARRSMGMIFQGFFLFAQRTAFRNICFPMEIAGVYDKQQMQERAMELLDLVGLREKANAYPSQLSGGQQQRIAIARALATNPKVLLCDEATSALDPTTTQSILSLLQDINQQIGVTIIIITHEMRVIEQVCHRVAVIDQSHIVEVGEVKDVFLRPQSQIAKQLILPRGEGVEQVTGERCLRIIFDGSTPAEPIISNMTLSCQAAVNILFADTKNIAGNAVGHMVVQLPEDETAQARILAYLDGKKLYYKEERLHDYV